MWGGPCGHLDDRSQVGGQAPRVLGYLHHRRRLLSSSLHLSGFSSSEPLGFGPKGTHSACGKQACPPQSGTFPGLRGGPLPLAAAGSGIWPVFAE